MKAVIQFLIIYFFIHTPLGISAKAVTKNNPVNSKIDNVLIFPDRAIVTRKVTVEVRPPGQAIYFDKLPGGLDRESLRAKISNNKVANILGIRSRAYQIKKSEVENQEYRDWSTKKAKYDKEMQVLRDTAQRLVRENNQLNELLNHYRESFPHNLHQGKWSDKQFRSFSKLALDRSDKMYKDWSRVFNQYKDLAIKRDFANQKLQELDKYAPKGWNRVWVDLRVFKKQKVSLELEYLVSQASWRSSYAIQIQSTAKKVNFIQQALIKQWTGEDWNKAKVVLSNYQSQLRAQAPQNSSYRLSYREVKEVKTSVKGTSKKNKNIMASSSGGNQPTEKIFREFPIKGKVDLPTGLPELKILIDRFKLHYDRFYEAIPSQMEMVYQRTTLKNTVPFALAAGPVDVYVDGLYQQQFQLPFTTKGKPIQINTGYNYDIQISRSVNNKTGKSGILGDKKEYEKIITNSVRNWSQDKVKLRVYEQTPKSEMQEIDVESNASPKQFNTDKEFETWSFWETTIPPDQSRKFVLTLKVVTPEDFGFSW